MKEYISLSTAKLAFEKGFNQLTHHKFIVNENTFGVKEIEGVAPYSADGFTTYYRPKQAKLQTWLRDNFNIHIFIQPIWNDDLLTVTEYWENIVSPLIKEVIIDDSFKHKTYEDALESALQFSLNLF